MKQKFLRSLWTVAAVIALGLPVQAATMLIPVGRVVGLQVSEGSVTVAAFDDLLGQEIREAGVEIGDEILSVDGKTIDSAEDLQRAVTGSDGSVELQLRRKDHRYELRVHPQVTRDGPKLGVLIREGVTGIGTVTYVDPESGEFGALGHAVSDGHGKICKMTAGQIYRARVVGIRRGECGAPGQLKGFVLPGAPAGVLSANTRFGIFGSGGTWHGEALPVAEMDEVEEGAAQILSTVDGEQVQSFSVEILRRNFAPGSNGRDLLLQVTDPKLLEATGGIVAGMSGSPILQNGRLVGAVTHVLVNDPTRGFGILIENMLAAAK